MVIEMEESQAIEETAESLVTVEMAENQVKAETAESPARII